MFPKTLSAPGRFPALVGAAAALLLLSNSWPVLAQEAASAAAEAPAAPEYLSQLMGNTVWTLVASMLVMFMQAGFACVEAGFTRAKNAGNIIMKNALDFAVGAPAFFLLGYGLMFGDDISGFLGWGKFALSSADPATADGLWQYTYWFFQCVFAATAATIVSGAIAERTNFKAYILLSLITTAIIYPVSGHWIWGGGWLSSLDVPMIDFAGSTVVHSVGGWVSLAGAWMLGPRIGKYAPDGSSKAFPGHNLPLAGLGVFILWFGWFGFNPGSTTAATGAIGYIAVNTNLAACVGTLAALFFSWLRYGKPDISMTLNGTLAGLVAITAGCNNVSPMSSMAIGAIAGVVVIIAIEFIDKVVKIDDPVGAISVHGVCGALGTILVGVFADSNFGGGPSGLLNGGGTALLMTQLLGVGSVFVWAFGLGLVNFGLVKVLLGIRASVEEELKGLDITEHGNEAYCGFQIFTTE